jgi:hypothetical protein
MDEETLENQNNQISLAGLNRGMYLLSLNDGKRKVVKKIIKQ